MRNHLIQRAARCVALSAVAASAVACTDVPRAFGPTPEAARTNADALLQSFADRFTGVTRTARYARARQEIGAHALIPSQIFSDSSIWTVFGPQDTRTLFGDASFANGHYTFTNVVTSAPLDKPGDGRHIMRLRKLSDNEYEWFAGADFAAGRMTAADFANVITRWLASAEGHNGADLRAAYTSAFPRTVAALGPLYSIDTLTSARTADGSNDLHIVIHVTPEGIRATLPDFASYMDKYVTRVKLQFVLVDSRGARWADVSSRDGYMALHLRSRDGHFAPLDGSPRAIPDTLIMKVDLTARIKIFTVGVEKLTGEWVNLQSEHERGWAMRFTKEPSWVLPPTVGMLVKSSLARPFQGAGTQFRFTVHDQPGQQTILARRTTLVVQESPVIRFLGKLGGTAMGDFVDKAEGQENRFNANVFTAMRADMDAILR